MLEISDLIGKPFAEMKCWDLVREVWKREGKELPDYRTLMIDGVVNEQDYGKEISKPVEGCICLYGLQSEGIDHAGIYLGNNQLLHATEGCGVCIERYSKYIPRLKGLYV